MRYTIAAVGQPLPMPFKIKVSTAREVLYKATQVRRDGGAVAVHDAFGHTVDDDDLRWLATTEVELG